MWGIVYQLSLIVVTPEKLVLFLHCLHHEALGRHGIAAMEMSEEEVVQGCDVDEM